MIQMVFFKAFHNFYIFSTLTANQKARKRIASQLSSHPSNNGPDYNKDINGNKTIKIKE